jgi:ATP-binding cassette, subfamily C (CFTR/MRP), member 1
VGELEGMQQIFSTTISADMLLNSGKSTLVLTLLRLLDLSSGSIEIDGIDISSVAQNQVRARIIAVAEEPFLFPGSIRENIDPYTEYEDETIEAALSDVALWHVVLEKGGLNQTLQKEMLSQGQRQLFQLARAILRRHVGKVVILDEITSRYMQDFPMLMYSVLTQSHLVLINNRKSL